jgi:hypothetical protein
VWGGFWMIRTEVMNFLDETRRGPAIQKLVITLNNRLDVAGFRETGYGEWKRDLKWRVDEIDLRVAAISRRRIQPAFRVAIPRLHRSPDDDETHRYLDEAKLPRIINPAAGIDSYITLPLMRFQIPRFVESLTSDISTALSWFDRFATPELCLKKLPELKKPGSPAFVDTEAYLKSIVKVQQ